MAIEDALELANQLGGATRQLEGQQGQQPGAGADYDTPAAVPALEAALRRYEEQRAPRAMRVSEQSLQVGRWGGWLDNVQCGTGTRAEGLAVCSALDARWMTVDEWTACKYKSNFTHGSCTPDLIRVRISTASRACCSRPCRVC